MLISVLLSVGTRLYVLLSAGTRLYRATFKNLLFVTADLKAKLPKS